MVFTSLVFMSLGSRAGISVTSGRIMSSSSSSNMKAGTHHQPRLRQQRLGLDLDSELESFAAVVAVEQLSDNTIFTGISELIVMRARGSRQLQPCEEGSVVVG
eukprot:scaffold48648_cov40-Phaeocystis_antarctica.AAC.4